VEGFRIRLLPPSTILLPSMEKCYSFCPKSPLSAPTKKITQKLPSLLQTVICVQIKWESTQMQAFRILYQNKTDFRFLASQNSKYHEKGVFFLIKTCFSRINTSYIAKIAANISLSHYSMHINHRINTITFFLISEIYDIF
jgi:hypothetical protein